jgi:hypothetical protein
MKRITTTVNSTELLLQALTDEQIGIIVVQGMLNQVPTLRLSPGCTLNRR